MNSKPLACNPLKICSGPGVKCRIAPAVLIFAIGLILNAALYSRLGYASFAMGGGGALLALLLWCACRPKATKIDFIAPPVKNESRVEDVPITFTLPFEMLGRHRSMCNRSGLRYDKNEITLPDGWTVYTKGGEGVFDILIKNDKQEPMGLIQLTNWEGVIRSAWEGFKDKQPSCHDAAKQEGWQLGLDPKAMNSALGLSE